MMTLSDYQALFRATPYPYLVMTPDLTIVGASGAYLRSVQRSLEEIVGRNVFDAFPAEEGNAEATNIGEVKASLLRALAKGEPDTTAFVRYAVEVNTPQGKRFEERYWSTVHTPVLNEEGTPILVVQNPVDVTELYRYDQQNEVATLQLALPSENNTENFNRAQMHEALSRILNNEREHLRSLFNQAPGFVAVLMGPKHVFEMVNEAYYQLVGHRELIGKAVWDALPEVAGQGFEQFLDQVYRTGVPWITRAMPIAIQREREGPISQRYIDLVYEPYKDQYGTTVGIFAQGYDVTDAVEAQAARRESDERLRDGMDAAKMAVWDWNFTTGELAYSDNIGLVLGFSPTAMDVVGPHIHPDDREKIDRAHREAIAGAGTYQEVVRFLRPDNGRQVWLDSRGKVQFDDEGKAVRMRGVTVDVTERYQAEFELREANRKKDEFLAMLAHELRNPLAPISTAAEMLRLTNAADTRTKKASEVISRQVKHMTALVDDLLDVSRVTRGLVELEKELVDIKGAVASAVEQARPLIEARRHALTVRTDATQATVLGDRTRLVQVIANLLNNAAKYTPQGGEITLAVHAEEGWVDIAVIDNGIGIDTLLLPHVFELFTQAARTPDRAQGGLGIGLALVKTMVALHGGTVTADSAGPGKGSTFTLRLPAITQRLKEHIEDAAREGMLAGPSPLRIMIVDDNVDAAESLAVLLEAQGHQVRVEAHPVPALAQAQLDPPEVLILDIGLPEMDGYELARRLRADPATSSALFIALTGYGQAHDRILSKSSGFEHHFVKPMDIERLGQVLGAVRPAGLS
ncbi:ATP-binding protein [Massilia sp. Mn16-1_5]|uniref:PAS domain-containing hybrid sensor histidine kinase/response regulator n=1 Tax=Massilia sp. Mn16-1_5 TaxID=2079199 RepID=UPI00109E65B3|nr:ATP-binding protein [Massilia sp. Mn16-1_5]THC41865.1 hybrid sensor histidine kinase/response regulator [Massilia sp. Mn16-1_5]